MMVSRGARELLKNTIRTVDHHNRMLEERIMWDLKSKRDTNSTSIRKTTKTRKSKTEEIVRKEEYKTKLAQQTKKAKWDHSGYLELYPEAANSLIESETKKKKKKIHKNEGKKKKEKKRRKTKKTSDTSKKEVWVEKTS